MAGCLGTPPPSLPGNREQVASTLASRGSRSWREAGRGPIERGGFVSLCGTRSPTRSRPPSVGSRTGSALRLRPSEPLRPACPYPSVQSRARCTTTAAAAAMSCTRRPLAHASGTRGRRRRCSASAGPSRSAASRRCRRGSGCGSARCPRRRIARSAASTTSGNGVEVRAHVAGTARRRRTRPRARLARRRPPRRCARSSATCSSSRSSSKSRTIAAIVARPARARQLVEVDEALAARRRLGRQRSAGSAASDLRASRAALTSLPVAKPGMDVDALDA